mmetsp:Transcript_25163/g.28143  ORF Transcript_25163/g.28143 Transcript_25163/m.28143 type:complete len:249 (-) Transcript_25163:467-1213(-)
MKFTSSSTTALAAIILVAVAPSHTCYGFVQQQQQRSAAASVTATSSTHATTTGLSVRNNNRNSHSPSLLMAEPSKRSMESVHMDADVIFSIIDKDGNGYIEKAELTSHLKPSGYTEQVIATIFGKMDMNKDGKISKQEFQGGMVLFSQLQSAPGLGNYNSEFVKEIHEDADQVFQSVDSDSDGSITSKELKNHMNRVKFNSYSEAALDRIFLMLDFDGNKGIDQEELRDAFVRFSALRQAIGEGPNYK